MKNDLSMDRLAFNPDRNTSKGIYELLKKPKLDDVSNIMPLPIENLEHYKNHPFKLYAKEKLNELAESIKANGVLMPIIVRPASGGLYEILAGHNRTEASRIAGKEYIPARIIECNDDEAMLIVTETNLQQREKLLPSEKAKAYKMQLEAYKAQGKRTDLLEAVENEKKYGHIVPECDGGMNNSGHIVPVNKYARDIVAEKNKTSARQISYYIRLLCLNQELLDMVDGDSIPFRAGVDVSYLRESEQEHLAEVLSADIKLTIETAAELKAESKEHELSNEEMDNILVVHPKVEDVGQKAQKPVPLEPSAYKIAIKSVKTYFKTLEPEKVEKLNLVGNQTLASVIKAAIEQYIASI